MTPAEPSTESAVRRELLRLALHNSGRSVPLQVVAVIFVAALGFMAGSTVASIATAIVGLAVAAWRWLISRRHPDAEALDARDVKAVERELEGNSLLAGLMWTISTWGIYPALQGTNATAYVVIVRM